ncbi:MAG: sphingosine kinase [Acidobacteria bacterium]|nr:sphingosine kinase [Acidobacteriota bacterium]
MEKSVAVIVNANSGSGSDEKHAEQIRDAFRAVGLSAEIFVAKRGEDLVKLAHGSVKSEASVIAAGGGDGTVSVIASAIAGTDKLMGVLPLGTLNHFAKDLDLPSELPDAAKVIAEGATAEIDLGSVNGRTFINNSSIGLYPRIVRRREMQQSLGRGKWAAAAWAALKVLRLSHFLTVKIVADDAVLMRRTPFVFVGNNDYDMDLYNIGRRPRLDRGKLSVYFLRRGGRWGVIVMLLKTMIGRLKQWEDFEALQTTSLTIESKKKQLFVAIDGEVTTFGTPLEYKILPGALRVIVPRREEEDQ